MQKSVFLYTRKVCLFLSYSLELSNFEVTSIFQHIFLGNLHFFFFKIDFLMNIQSWWKKFWIATFLYKLIDLHNQFNLLEC